MSRTASHRPFWPSYIALLLFILILTLQRRVGASPLWNFAPQYGNTTTESLMESSTDSSTVNSMGSTTSPENLENISTASLKNNLTENLKNSSTENLENSSTENLEDNSTDNSTEITPNTDVYVIKAVVYEIGILTDTDNTTSSESTESQERIDISLYSAPQEDAFS